MSHGSRDAADPVAVEASVTVPVGPVLARRSRRPPLSILVALGVGAIAFAVGLHLGGAPSGETAALRRDLPAADAIDRGVECPDQSRSRERGPVRVAPAME